MRYFIGFFLFIVLLSGYLNFAYKRIYDYTIRPHLLSPYKENTYYLNTSFDKKEIRYVALGDSLTAGVGSSDYKKTWPYLMALNLAKNSALVLINEASSGATAKDVLLNQVPETILENPDYVSLLIGVNDIHNLRSKKDFEDDYRKIVDEITKKTAAQVILINIPYLGENMLIWPPYNLLLDLRTRQFNTVIKQIANEKNLLYIDIYTLVLFKDHDLYSSDQFHPSEKGYLLLGDIINANFNR